jgi:hypothetical protein
MLPLLITGLNISIHVLEVKDNNFSLHCPYGYTSTHKKTELFSSRKMYTSRVGETDSWNDSRRTVRDMCKRIVPNTQDVVINHLINTEKLTRFTGHKPLKKQCDGEGLFVPFKTAGQMDMDLRSYIWINCLNCTKPWNSKSATVFIQQTRESDRKQMVLRHRVHRWIRDVVSRDRTSLYIKQRGYFLLPSKISQYSYHQWRTTTKMPKL